MARNKSINVILNLKDKFTKPVQKSASEIKKFERDVKRAENNIKKGFNNMTKSAKESAKNMVKSMDDVVKKSAKLGAIGAGAAGLAIGKGLKDSIDVGRTFEQSMANVTATVGLDKSTAEGMKAYEDLEKKARDVAKVSKFTAGEVADAMNYMAMAGWKTEQMVGNGLDKILQLAGASGTDVATTSDIVTDALTAFGLTANDAGKFADIMASTASNANTNVAMMGETFSYAAPVAGALGHSAQDTALAIGLMGNAGIKASMAGTALRTMMTNLQGTVELSGDQLGKWVIETTKADGSMREFRDIVIDLREAFSNMTESEKAANAESIAGKTGMSGLLAVVNASEEDFNKLANAIDNSEGATARMEATTLDTVNGAMAILNSTLDELRLKVWDKIKTPLKNLIRSVSDALPKAFDKCVKVAAKVKNVFGRITNEVRYMWDIMVQKIAGVLMKHQDSVFKIIDIYYALKNTGKKVGESLKAAFEKIEPIVQWLMHTGLPAIVDLLMSVIDVAFNVYNTIVDNWGAIVPIVSGIVAAMVTYKTIMFLSNLQTKLLTGTMVVLNGIIKGITIVQGILNATFLGCPVVWLVLGIGALVAAGVALVMNWDKICETGKQVWENLKQWVGEFANFFIDKINWCINGLNNLLSFKLPDFLGGKEFGVNIPTIPNFATGTSYHRGGLARINEGGRGEIVNLPNGSQVIPHDKSKKSAGQSGVSVSVPITIQGNVYGDRDLVDRVGGMIAQRVQLAIGNV